VLLLLPQGIKDELSAITGQLGGIASRLKAVEDKAVAAPAADIAAAAPVASPSASTSGGHSSSFSSGFTAKTDGGLEHPFTMHNRVVLKKLRAAGKSVAGQSVVVGGWVRTGRKAEKGAIAFLEIGDGSCIQTLQVVVPKELADVNIITKAGTCIMLRGDVVESPKEGQEIELKATEMLWLGPCDPTTYPVPKSKDLTLEALRNVAHFRSRTYVAQATFRIRNALASATHQFFQSNGFNYLHAPIITSHDAEGAGEMFQISTLLLHADEKAKKEKPGAEAIAAAAAATKAQGDLVAQMNAEKKDKRKIKVEASKLEGLKETQKEIDAAARELGGIPRTEDGDIDYEKDFFNKKAFLTVSGQLDAEAYAVSMTSVYTFGPTFRAEDSHTTRHLAEFWMIEPEIAFCDIQGDMKCAEEYVQFCLKFVLEHCYDDMKFLSEKIDPENIARCEQVANTPFTRLTYTDACELLIKHVAEGKKTFEEEVSWGIDLGSEHERYLAEEVFKGPVILYNYPAEIKAFYMRLNDDKKTVAAMDVLVPGVGELIGGSQREERIDVLEEKMKACGIDPASMKWYSDLRNYGGVPHAGFGLGFERLVLFTTGHKNIRDVIPFPRWPGHIM
jgi:asparaginyl-tRNA synthetase